MQWEAGAAKLELFGCSVPAPAPAPIPAAADATDFGGGGPKAGRACSGRMREKSRSGGAGRLLLPAGVRNGVREKSKLRGERRDPCLV